MKAVLHEYSDRWPLLFNEVSSYLKDNVPSCLNIEHVGSTSIPGMCAKPIIDIDIIIESRDKLPVIIKELESIGYMYEGNLGIKDREAFKRSGVMNTILDKIDHHLYVCPKDSKELHNHIVFRNVLRTNTTLRDEYISIKKSIIDKVGVYNRKEYQIMKEAIYKEKYLEIINIDNGAA